MCPICHRFHHASNCPNAPASGSPYICFKCTAPIYRGDKAFRMDNNIVLCEDCISDAAFIVTEVE